jgi:hypothetical protein
MIRLFFLMYIRLLSYSDFCHPEPFDFAQDKLKSKGRQKASQLRKA